MDILVIVWEEADVCRFCVKRRDESPKTPKTPKTPKCARSGEGGDGWGWAGEAGMGGNGWDTRDEHIKECIQVSMTYAADRDIKTMLALL
jgi:hypothetical protein